MAEMHKCFCDTFALRASRAGVLSLTRQLNVSVSRMFSGIQQSSNAYSRFCTCSRNCSIATFISTEMFVNSSDEAFDPRVLASRSNS